MILDLFEIVSGSRMMTSYMRIGGVAADLPEDFLPTLDKFLKELPVRIEEFETLFARSEIFFGRTKNIAIIDAQTALEYGVTGPNLRAAGIKFDLRKDAPYSCYNKFNFEVPVAKNGDCYDRFCIRLAEVKESAKIIRQAADSLPEGPVLAKVPKVIKPPVGECYHQIEHAKGSFGFYLASDGSTKPYRLHIHSPSFVNIGVLPKVAKGLTVQDFICLLASLDFILGEVDR
jgi:NADH-quinone oxidoreductase subunit D